MKNFAVIYLVDISEVPDFNAMYELYDPCTVMFFFRNKVGERHACVGLGGGGGMGWGWGGGGWGAAECSGLRDPSGHYDSLRWHR